MSRDQTSKNIVCFRLRNVYWVLQLESKSDGDFHHLLVDIRVGEI